MIHSHQHELGPETLLAEITRLNRVIDTLLLRLEAHEANAGLVANPADSALLENELFIRNLRESEAIFRQMFERHNAVMLLIDYHAGIIIDANPAAVQFYGYPRERMRGMSVARINAQPESEIHEHRQRAIFGVQNKFIFEHRLASNEVRTVEVHISTVHYKEKSLFFSIVHDVTERKQSDELIRNLAFRDHLTQLPNRRLFNDRLAQAITASKRSGQHGAMVMIDLDNFKPLNDTHGHAVGDLLLIEAASRLKSCIREIDTVARFGGDEFVVILTDLNTDKDQATNEACLVAEKILASLSQIYVLSVNLHGQYAATIEHHSTASLGVKVFLDKDGRLDEIMRHADEAMYQAKEAGRNRVCIHGTEVAPAPAI